MFFDEPTTGLDPIMGAVIDGLVVDCVKRLGSTAVAITHDMASARRIGDAAAMIYQRPHHLERPGGALDGQRQCRRWTSSRTDAAKGRSRWNSGVSELVTCRSYPGS